MQIRTEKVKLKSVDTMENGRYIFGDGTGEYVIGTISGNVRITAPNKK